MPTYEYVCTECKEPLEVVQSIHDASLTQCPSCGGRLRKVFGNVGVVFKGSGFYKNDSRAAAKKAKSGKSDSGAAAASKEGTESAAKPASSDSSGAGSTPSSTPSTSTGSSTSASKTPSPANKSD